MIAHPSARDRASDSASDGSAMIERGSRCNRGSGIGIRDQGSGIAHPMRCDGRGSGDQGIARDAMPCDERRDKTNYAD